ncbi:EcoAI/FtnUII family type I restriction enzme subunit R [Methylophaga thiooxydans]|uniref:Type III restriction enzyme, res subunit family n=1 Tax=Methylophaga thiooxydans DMS010 TaxID=637616 RepID=C0N6G5_9GAMM|nr:type I restriction endonuclease subunit R [Methylophaga thiooxydans]EEF79338.1 Type III restriction enzyme, res subunit family [Methylophaga thiooxydans DMS010]
MANARMRNEADTRADLIDPKLIEVGWGAIENSYIRREVSITKGRIIGAGKRASALSSDYVLEYQGRKLAAIEAKKESLSYTEGVRQAKDYAERLQCRFGYATNGHDIYQIDLETHEEKLVEAFLSPEEIWRLTFDPTQKPGDKQTEPDFAAVWRERFAQIPFEAKGDWQPRYYQENAINNALDAIAKGEERILLTLATGTGKTCIAFQVAWKLFHSRWSLSAQREPEAAKKRPRILFLADRNVLANQAFNDFGPFGEDAIVRLEPSEIKKKGAVPKNASVFFTIFQTFMSGTDEDGNPAPYFGDYPEDFFDFIVIDECHRGGANDESTWRDILNYFSPAVQLGLTATPKRTVNADTYTYFGEPVYTYALKEGINDGFLTPFKVLPIVGTMDEYIYTPGDGLIIKGEPEQGKVYKEGDFNRVITIPEREKMRVHYWMDRFNPHEKTLVFCATQEHAGMVRDFINQYAVEKGWTTNSNYCVRVTANDGSAGENDLKTFQDNEKTIPTILTTSRKLSTGVDARNVRNIVLMRPCNNMIEFKQIIGRGTRMYDGKDYFTIYDFVKAHYNFADPEWDGEPEPVEVCEECGKRPCSCEKPDTPPTGYCSKCDNEPCICEKPEPPVCEDCGQRPCVCEKKIVIKLSDGKTRTIQHISSALYWSPEGKPITAKEFVERMFDDLPQFFGDEDQLRAIWSDPTTRDKLLEDLAEAGYDNEKLDSMKDLIDAKDSDVYDVLAFVAYAKDAQTRQHRVDHAKPAIKSAFADPKQQEFIDFVLIQYIGHGVEELSLNKMSDLLELKYNSIHDAADYLGSTAVIREAFVGCQRYLYA